MISRAEVVAKEIKLGSIEYAEDVLSTLEHNLKSMLQEVERNRKIRVLDEHGLEMVDFVVDKEYARVTARAKKKARILKVDWYNIPASAGTGSFLDNETAEPILVYETSEAERADFALSVSGDSMEPVYHDGQIVWVQQCDRVGIGEVGIFIYDGEGYIKAYDEQMPDEDVREDFTDSYVKVYDEQEPDEEDREYFMDSSGTVHMQPIMVSYNRAYKPRVISAHSNFQVVGRVL